MPSRGPYWLTIAQAALEFKDQQQRRALLVRTGKLPTVGIDGVDVCRASRDGVEYVKKEVAAGHLRIVTDLTTQDRFDP